VQVNAIHRLFKAGLWLKGLNAALESLGGVMLAALGVENVKVFIQTITQSELLEDPRDILANSLLKFAQGFSVSSEQFYAFYLLGHGVVKLALVYGLARQKTWAFPMAMVAIAGFIIYQSYRVSYTYSIGLALLTVFDCVFLVVIWQEFKIARHQMQPGR
jgi:uncharacterized membrane protein